MGRTIVKQHTPVSVGVLWDGALRVVICLHDNNSSSSSWREQHHPFAAPQSRWRACASKPTMHPHSTITPTAHQPASCTHAQQHTCTLRDVAAVNTLATPLSTPSNTTTQSHQQAIPPGFLQELNTELMHELWFTLAAAKHPELNSPARHLPPSLDELLDQLLKDLTWPQFWAAFPYELR